MQYQTFLNRLKSDLQHFAGPQKKLQLHSIRKNNGVFLDALTIFSSDSKLSPTVYLDDYYQSLCCGRPYEDVLREIQEVFSRRQPSLGFSPDQLCDFSFVKDRIVFHIINRKWNCELLSEIPHVPYLDLAIVFDFLIESSDFGNVSILIRNEHLSLWERSCQELYRLALENTPRLLNWECADMASLLQDAGALDHIFASSIPRVPLYVLTNAPRFYGASCILYPKVLEEISLALASDLCVLPSSIHETILLPLSPALSLQGLNSIICQINQEALSQGDRLSDHAYFYSRLGHTLRMHQS